MAWTRTHTLVRLPNGVFSPYTPIPTNLLFFDRSGPTQEIWCYEIPLPEGRKNYTKTKPMQFEDFTDCIAWWGKRTETDLRDVGDEYLHAFSGVSSRWRS